MVLWCLVGDSSVKISSSVSEFGKMCKREKLKITMGKNIAIRRNIITKCNTLRMRLNELNLQKTKELKFLQLIIFSG